MPRHAVHIIVLAVAVASLCLVRWITVSAPLVPRYSSPYDEGEILSLITNIYKILIRQGHFDEHDVVWAPPEGHTIDLSVLDDPDRIDERVISLMKKLPSGPNACVAPRMRPVFYMSRDQLVRSRDIDRSARIDGGFGPVDQTNALPTIIQLLEGWESTDPMLVLDVADNTIRFFNEVYNGPHYLDFPAEHAPTYLRRMWNNYSTASWVSDFMGGILETDSWWCDWQREVQRTLLEDYHWPGPSFRCDDWERDRSAIIEGLTPDVGAEQAAAVAAFVRPEGWW